MGQSNIVQVYRQTCALPGFPVDKCSFRCAAAYRALYRGSHHFGTFSCSPDPINFRVRPAVTCEKSSWDIGTCLVHTDSLVKGFIRYTETVPPASQHAKTLLIVPVYTLS